MGFLKKKQYDSLPMWPGIIFVALILGPVIIFSIGSLLSQNREKDQLPDIVVMTLDTLRQDRIGCYGSIEVRTPTLDFLSRRGILYRECLTVAPETVPAHASLFTGLLPTSNGALDNRFGLQQSATMLAEILKERGYQTGAVTNAVLSLNKGFDQGFDLFNGKHPTPESTPASELPFSPKAHQLLSSANAQREDPFSGYRTTGRGIEQLQQFSKSPAPLFFWLHYWDAHLPYDPPDLYRELYECPRDGGLEFQDSKVVREFFRSKRELSESELHRMNALYNGDVSFCDEQVGRFLRAYLKDRDPENVWLIVLSDHGETLYDHDYYIGHGLSLRQEAVAIPLIMVGDFLSRGDIVSEGVSILDIPTTVLHELGISKRQHFSDGFLLPVVGDISGKNENRGFGNRAACLARSNLSKELLARVGSLKLVGGDTTTVARLFNLDNDPRERSPLRIPLTYPDASTSYVKPLIQAFTTFQKRIGQSPFSQVPTQNDEQVKKFLEELGYVEPANSTNGQSKELDTQ